MTSGAPKKSWRMALLRLLGSAVALGLLFLLLPREELKAAIARLSLVTWLLVLLSYMALHFLGITKWWLMVNLAKAGLPYVAAIRCYFAGLFGSIYLPSIVGGDLVRAGLAFRSARSKIGLLLGSMMDRIQDLIALSIVAGIGALLLPTALDAQSRRVFWWLAAAFAVGIAGLTALLLLTPVKRFSYRMRRRFVRLRQALRTLASRPHINMAALSLGVLLQVGLTLLNVWLADACGLEIAWNVWLFAWPLAKITAMMPISQGGIGVREASLVVLLKPFGAPAALAFAAGLVFQTIIISGGLLGGLIAVSLGSGSLFAFASAAQAERK